MKEFLKKSVCHDLTYVPELPGGRSDQAEPGIRRGDSRQERKPVSWKRVPDPGPFNLRPDPQPCFYIILI